VLFGPMRFDGDGSASWARSAWARRFCDLDGTFRLTSSLLLWLMLISLWSWRDVYGAVKEAAGWQQPLALFAGRADVLSSDLSVNVWRGLHPNTKTVSSLAPGMRWPLLSVAGRCFSALWGGAACLANAC